MGHDRNQGIAAVRRTFGEIMASVRWQSRNGSGEPRIRQAEVRGARGTRQGRAHQSTRLGEGGGSCRRGRDPPRSPYISEGMPAWIPPPPGGDIQTLHGKFLVRTGNSGQSQFRLPKWISRRAVIRIHTVRQKMIRFHRLFLGVIASAVVMIPIYLGLWLYEIGGTKGMMNDDSYPMSIFFVPLMAALVSGGVFWIIVFPCAQASRWIANRKRLTLSYGCMIAVYVPALLGVLLGVLSGSIYSALAAGSYLGLASYVFWRIVAKREVEQGAP